jgi:hypothetical protein
MEADIQQNKPLSSGSVTYLEETFYESMVYLNTVIKEP